VPGQTIPFVVGTETIGIKKIYSIDVHCTLIWKRLSSVVVRYEVDDWALLLLANVQIQEQQYRSVCAGEQGSCDSKMV